MKCLMRWSKESPFAGADEDTGYIVDAIQSNESDDNSCCCK